MRTLTLERDQYQTTPNKNHYDVFTLEDMYLMFDIEGECFGYEFEDGKFARLIIE